jgi:hypothetical protein
MAIKTLSQQIQEQRFLAIALFAIAFGIIITNMISEDTAVVFASWSYVVTAGSFAVLALIMIVKTRGIGNHGKSWILFAVFAISWMTAEMVWSINELILEVDPYPSLADFFWLLGYPFYFGFLILYLKPFRKAISKKMIVSSSVISIVFLISAFYVSYDTDLELTDFDNILALSYPLLDAIVLVPALIGVTLFLTGKVNFLWTLMCLAIICVIIADIGFYFGTLDDDYYSGHPIEILFHWVYILFAFGIYNHLKVFKTRKINDV